MVCVGKATLFLEVGALFEFAILDQRLHFITTHLTCKCRKSMQINRHPAIASEWCNIVWVIIVSIKIDMNILKL